MDNQPAPDDEKLHVLPLAAAISSISVMGIAIGLGMLLLSVILEARGISATMIGLNTATAGLARTLRLSHEGRTVAMLFGLIDKNHFRYIILACDYARYADHSSGLLIFDRAIASWAEAGGEVFDFTIGDERYKRELGCTSTPMFAFAID